MMLKFRVNKSAAEALIIIAAITALTVFGKESVSGALKGIYFCLNDLLPSVFPFMALSVLTAKSRAGEMFSKLFGRAFSKLFGLPKNLCAVFILSLIGGYPVGARGINALLQNRLVSEKEAKGASLIAVGAGPGFLINFVGIRLFGSAQIGAVLLVSQILSVIILGILNKFIFVRKKNFNSHEEFNPTFQPFTDALTESVISAAYGALEMCATVVAFSALIGIADSIFGESTALLSIFLEVTNACTKLAGKSVILTAFAAGFGGLCVHFQIFTALKGINKPLFFLFRIIQGLLSALFTLILIKIFNLSLPTFSGANGYNYTLSSSVIGSAALIISGASFIYSIRRKICAE